MKNQRKSHKKHKTVKTGKLIYIIVHLGKKELIPPPVALLPACALA
jgi:hypothetical protein